MVAIYRLIRPRSLSPFLDFSSKFISFLIVEHICSRSSVTSSLACFATWVQTQTKGALIPCMTDRHCPSNSSMAVLYLKVFLFTVLFVSAWLFVAQAKMFADCTFGKVNTTEGQKMSATFIGKLAGYKHMSHSCVVKTDGINHQNHFFQVKAKRNKESKGETTSCVRFNSNLAEKCTFFP